MAKIQNTTNYPIKENPVANDYVVGTDSTDGSTKNFTVDGIASAASGAAPSYATFALLEADIPNLTTGKTYLVTVDETNGNTPTTYFFDGTNLNWIVSQQA